MECTYLDCDLCRVKADDLERSHFERVNRRLLADSTHERLSVSEVVRHDSQDSSEVRDPEPVGATVVNVA
jgi:hypothetical protein